MLFFIILIALAQELAIYFSGANKSMRILATVGGFFLFLLASCFILYGLMPGFGLLIVLVLLSVLLVRVYVHLIPEGYVDIVNSFGRYSRTLYPGFNILLPWEKVLRRLNTGETQWICPPQRVQLSPDEDLVLRATISYQLLPEDAYLAVTQVNNWEESLREQFKIILQTIATQFTPHDFVVWPQGQATDMHTVLHAEGSAITGNFPRWERVNTYLFQQLGDSVALWGVQINWVRIRDVALTPHGAPVVETPPPVERAVPAKSTAAPPATAQKPAAPVQAAPEPEKKSAAPRSIPAKFLKEEVLIKAYKEVQDGKITDPLTIHSLAEKFEAVANDPQACQTVSFDAARAAHTLHKQAQKYEELYVAEASFEEKGQASWPMSNPSDENLMAGG
ncbi:hypothetical protein EPA93_35870 [Ktedonosporobacter rubrisoli]|uniref:Band 7 domain-containing protein n=1 Tax=Ktedonosporobacter rubrisoli TaxID=2509675 RepID=A0A4P6JZW6_KTERU|nr:SPFH domain-containing protein [Ktedonosporobacter rubrisoli]QBD81063.1 hypothetical protein EPA93_35870 [Ktedonosporobacter rubrisoli]